MDLREDSAHLWALLTKSTRQACQPRRFILNRFSLALLFWLSVGTVESTSAAVLFSQTNPDEPIGAFSSQDATSGQMIADNFILAGDESLTVCSLRLIGARINDASPEPANVFRVVFLEDSGGLPGSIVPGGDFDGELLNAESPTGGQLLNGLDDPIEYIVDLGNGISLSPDTPYWIAVTNDPGPGFGWLWARAVGTVDAQIATVSSTSGDFSNLPWVPGASSGMWFELSRQNTPEPSSLFLLALGCTQVAAVRSGGLL